MKIYCSFRFSWKQKMIYTSHLGTFIFIMKFTRECFAFKLGKYEVCREVNVSDKNLAQFIVDRFSEILCQRFDAQYLKNSICHGCIYFRRNIFFSATIIHNKTTDILQTRSQSNTVITYSYFLHSNNDTIGHIIDFEI